MKVIGTINGIWVKSNTGNITLITNDPFPNMADNFFYQQVSAMPKLVEDRIIGASKFLIKGNHVVLPEIPAQHQYKFDADGNYKCL